MKKTIFFIEGVLQLLISIGALAAGFLMVIKPDGSAFGMPLSILNGSPFTDFLIPGIILFLVNGAGNLAAGILSIRKHNLAGFAGIFFGSGLVIWIFVQVSMIGGGHWLQNLYFTLGMLELLLGFAIREVQIESK
jgi:hypothetical protein